MTCCIAAGRELHVITGQKEKRIKRGRHESSKSNSQIHTLSLPYIEYLNITFVSDTHREIIQNFQVYAISSLLQGSYLQENDKFAF